MSGRDRGDRQHLVKAAAENVSTALVALSQILKSDPEPRTKLQVALNDHLRECTRALETGIASGPVLQDTDGVAQVARTLRELARSFDRIVTEAALEVGVSGYDNVVTETLGDGLLSELSMLAKGLAEYEQEAALERKLRTVRSLVPELAPGDYPVRPPAPSRSRGEAPPAPVSVTQGRKV